MKNSEKIHTVVLGRVYQEPATNGNVFYQEIGASNKVSVLKDTYGESEVPNLGGLPPSDFLKRYMTINSGLVSHHFEEVYKDKNGNLIGKVKFISAFGGTKHEDELLENISFAPRMLFREGTLPPIVVDEKTGIREFSIKHLLHIFTFDLVMKRKD